MTTDEDQVQCHMSDSDDIKSKNYDRVSTFWFDIKYAKQCLF